MERGQSTFTGFPNWTIENDSQCTGDSIIRMSKNYIIGYILVLFINIITIMFLYNNFFDENKNVLFKEKCVFLFVYIITLALFIYLSRQRKSIISNYIIWIDFLKYSIVIMELLYTFLLIALYSEYADFTSLSRISILLFVLTTLLIPIFLILFAFIKNGVHNLWSFIIIFFLLLIFGSFDAEKSDNITVFIFFVFILLNYISRIIGKDIIKTNFDKRFFNNFSPDSIFIFIYLTLIIDKKTPIFMNIIDTVILDFPEKLEKVKIGFNRLIIMSILMNIFYSKIIAKFITIILNKLVIFSKPSIRIKNNKESNNLKLEITVKKDSQCSIENIYIINLDGLGLDISSEQMKFNPIMINKKVYFDSDFRKNREYLKQGNNEISNNFMDLSLNYLNFKKDIINVTDIKYIVNFRRNDNIFHRKLLVVVDASTIKKELSLNTDDNETVIEIENEIASTIFQDYEAILILDLSGVKHAIYVNKQIGEIYRQARNEAANKKIIGNIIIYRNKIIIKNCPYIESVYLVIDRHEIIGCNKVGNKHLINIAFNPYIKFKEINV